MNLCQATTKLINPSGYHTCSLDEHAGPMHLCQCGHTWGQAKSTQEEIANDHLPLHFALSEKQIIDLYLTVDNNDRLVEKFITQHVKAGLAGYDEAQYAISIAHETSRRILGQISNQYPMISARAAQIRQHMKQLGIIE